MRRRGGGGGGGIYQIPREVGTKNPALASS